MWELKKKVDSKEPEYVYRNHPSHGNLIKEDSAAE